MAKREKGQGLVLFAFVALFLGGIGLLLQLIFKESIFSLIVSAMFAILAAVIAYPITKDGKDFFKSFYKISYLSSVILFGIVVIGPIVSQIVELAK